MIGQRVKDIFTIKVNKFDSGSGTQTRYTKLRLGTRSRHYASVFQTIMPMLKKEKVGAINWGFVSGKTNTIFAWDTPLPNMKEPPLWFHDILRQDGTPFSKDEIKVIKELTGKTNR